MNETSKTGPAPASDDSPDGVELWGTATGADLLDIPGMLARREPPAAGYQRERAMYDALQAAAESTIFAAPEVLPTYLFDTGRVPSVDHPLNRAFLMYLVLQGVLHAMPRLEEGVRDA